MQISWRSPYTWLCIFLALITIWLGYEFAKLWITLSLAFALAYFLHPLQIKLEKKLNKYISAAIVVSLFMLILFLLGLMFSSLVSHAMHKLNQQYEHILLDLQNKISPWFKYIGIDFKQTNIFEWIKLKLVSQIQSIANFALSSIMQSANFFMGIITNLLLLPILIFYFLIDWQSLKLKLSLLIPKEKRPPVNKIINKINILMSSYSKGQIYLILSLAIYYIATLNLIGLDKASVIGLFTACAILIPYIGFMCGLALALIIGILQYGFTAPIALIMLIYSIGQFVESFYLTPRLIGESVGLHPISVIIALIILGKLLGFIGMLFALPIAGILQLMVKECYRSFKS